MLLAIVLSPWAVGTWVERFGPSTAGTVLTKTEHVQLSRDDRFEHELKIGYRYRPAGSPTSETGEHRVDAAMFERLQPGMPVEVRYHPWPALRLLGGYGSLLEGSTAWSRFAPLEGAQAFGVLDLSLIAVAALACWLAWVGRSGVLALLAGVLCSAVVDGVLVLGALVWPTWWLLWRRRKGQGYGWGLILSVVLGSLVLAVRMPWPPAPPAGPVVTATATVEQSKRVERIWGTRRRSGEPIARPFLLLDLALTLPGRDVPVHAVDRVDASADARYAKGARVEVVYPAGDPRHAQVSGAARTYGLRSFEELLAHNLEYGLVVLLAGWLLLKARDLLSLRAPWRAAARRRAAEGGENVDPRAGGDAL